MVWKEIMDCLIWYTQMIIIFDLIWKVMKLKLLVIGFFVVLISILGYVDTPILISKMVHAMMNSMVASAPGSSSITTSSMLHSMGYPSRSTVVTIMQYSFLGLVIMGIGMMMFGAVTKKHKKQFTVELVTDEQHEMKESHTNSQSMDEKLQTIPHGLRILQERLAKGEITSKEFQRLKGFLE